MSHNITIFCLVQLMINWNALKKRYLKDENPVELGNLASNLVIKLMFGDQDC